MTTTDARAALARIHQRETERGWMEVVTDWAKLRGWLIYHTHDSRHSAAGFPDLVMVRDGRLILAELKAAKGRETVQQREWLEQLAATPAEVYLWRPADWETVREVLL